MNRVEIAGGLTKDPEMRYTPSGAAVVNMTVAVNGTRFDAQKREQVVTTSFIAVEAWGSLAEEIAEQDLTKGSEVYVLGELTQRVTETNGRKDHKTRVRAMVVNVVRRRGGGSQLVRDTVARAPETPAPPYEGPPPGYNDDEEPFLVPAGEWMPGQFGGPARMLP